MCMTGAAGSSWRLFKLTIEVKRQIEAAQGRKTWFSGGGHCGRSHSIADPPEIASTMSRLSLLPPSAGEICRGIMASYPPMFEARRRLDAPQEFRLAGRL